MTSKELFEKALDLHEKALDLKEKEINAKEDAAAAKEWLKNQKTFHHLTDPERLKWIWKGERAAGITSKWREEHTNGEHIEINGLLYYVGYCEGLEARTAPADTVREIINQEVERELETRREKWLHAARMAQMHLKELADIANDLGSITQTGKLSKAFCNWISDQMWLQLRHVGKIMQAALTAEAINWRGAVDFTAGMGEAPEDPGEVAGEVAEDPPEDPGE